jgi:ABC-type polysaccharide/polyol phosphate export permease
MKHTPIQVELWRFRGLLRSLIIRDLKVKYQRSLLGLVWTLLNPLLTVAILVTVFSYVLRIQVDRYWAFLISGLFAWNFLQQCLYHAVALLRDNAHLNRSVYFPREILLLGAAMSKMVEFLIELAIVTLVLLVFHHHTIPSSFVVCPIIIAILFVMVVGLMFPLAVLAVFFYDVQQALPIVVLSLFYLSPVFYPVEMVPESFRPFMYLNPITGILSLFHTVFYSGLWPSWTLLGTVAATAMALFALGYWIFRRYQGICVEIA